MQPTRETIRLGAGQTFRLLQWSRDIGQIETIVAPGKTVPLAGYGEHWHYHSESELAFFRRGAGTRFVGDRIELFESGDLVLIGANVPHYWHVKGASEGLAIQWDFPLDHGVWTFGQAAPLRALAESARHGLQLQGNTARAVRDLLEHLPRRGGLGRLAAFLDLLSVLTTAPAADLRRLTARPFSLSGTGEQQEAIRRAVSYIIAHHRETVSLADLLRLTGMSRATFARQFRRHAGKSFSTFHNEVRLQAVCRLLQDTRDPIGSIALENGFNQLSFFNRLFRREFGMSPGEYRSRRAPRPPPCQSCASRHPRPARDPAKSGGSSA